jgi:hypothetical protein
MKKKTTTITTKQQNKKIEMHLMSMVVVTFPQNKYKL